MLKIKSCVVQEESFGCTIACIATILQKPYWEISRDFGTNFEKEGISSKQAANYIASYGFDIIWKAIDYYSSGYDIIKKRMLVPFADIHIVSIKQFSDDDDKGNHGHATIMTKEGKLLCPSDGKEYIKEFVEVNSIFGYFYPKGWDFKKRKIENALDNSSNRLNISNSKSTS